jgi:Sec-independent protein translocase protein TatA
VLAVAVRAVGPKNLSGIGRGLGQAIRGFKDAVKDGDAEDPERRSWTHNYTLIPRPRLAVIHGS